MGGRACRPALGRLAREAVTGERGAGERGGRPPGPGGAAGAVLRLQRTAGNQAVLGLLWRAGAGLPPGPGRDAAGGPPAVQRGGTDPVERGDRSLPNAPSIAASASGLDTSHFGHHASVFVATRSGPTLQHWKIDLTNQAAAPDRFAIVVQPATVWPNPASSTTWAVTAAAAAAALQKAGEFQRNAGEYRYTKLGVGPGNYNCALFVEKILAAAGVSRSAGLIVSTPKQVATGKVL